MENVQLPVGLFFNKNRKKVIKFEKKMFIVFICTLKIAFATNHIFMHSHVYVRTGIGAFSLKLTNTYIELKIIICQMQCFIQRTESHSI